MSLVLKKLKGLNMLQRRSLKWLLLLALIGILSACARQDEPLPTLIDLQGTIDAQSTSDAILLATSQAEPTSTPTRLAPTLPPTFTPTVPPTPSPTDPASAPTATPPGYHADGTIYYIYNGDSIAALAGDGSSDELILRGGPFSDLTASPDGQLLTYVAPGTLGGQEVWAASRDGTYTQQISCLTYPLVRFPVWSPDGRSVAFLAAAGVGAPYDLYIADFAGATTCPEGNNQRMLAQLNAPNVYGLTWSPDGTRLFFSTGPIGVYDIAADFLNMNLTVPSGFGPDTNPVHHPTEPRLFYLHAARSDTTGQLGGAIYEIPTTDITERPQEIPGAKLFAHNLIMSPDGGLLVASVADGFSIYNIELRSSAQPLDDLPSIPYVAIDPKGERVAYAPSADTSVQQIFVMPRSGGVKEQLTDHTEGSIDGLIWLEG